MKKPKYLGKYHPRCLVKLYCHDTGRWSILPTFGVTSTSDNTCDWDDFAAYCKRVGICRDWIEQMSRGENFACFEPIGKGGFAAIGVTPPFIPCRLNIFHEQYRPTVWITDEKYDKEMA